MLTNCTFNRNVAEAKKAGQALAVHGAVASLANCILWDHVDATASPDRPDRRHRLEHPTGGVLLRRDGRRKTRSSAQAR